MTWNPPPAVRALGERWRGTIPVVGGSQLGPGMPIQAEPWPGVVEIGEFIKAKFGVSEVGIRRGLSLRRPAQRPDGTYRKRDVHEEGRAGDVMIGRGMATGAAVANFLVTHANVLGVQYIIWDSYEWSASNYGDAFESYSTSVDRDAWGRDRRRSPHTDHVHFEVSPEWARDAARVRAALQRIEPGLTWRHATPGAWREPAGSTPTSTNRGPAQQPAPRNQQPTTTAQSSASALDTGLTLAGVAAGLWAAWRIFR